MGWEDSVIKMDVEVLVIGGGMAGTMAALAARGRGASVVLVRKAFGATALSSGGLAAEKVNGGEEAIGVFGEHLSAAGLAYEGQPDRPATLFTTMGTLATERLYPTTMAAGVIEELAGAHLLFVGVRGLADFAFVARSAAWLSETGRAAVQFSADHALVELPGPRQPYNPTPFELARLLDDVDAALELAAAVRPVLGDHTHVALPPILGLTVFKQIARSMGAVRYNIFMHLFLWFLLMPIKMGLRWTVNLKYFVGMPEYFFNI